MNSKVKEGNIKQKEKPTNLLLSSDHVYHKRFVYSDVCNKLLVNF